MDSLARLMAQSKFGNKMAKTAPFYYVFAEYAYFNNLLLSLHFITFYG